jgi:hypothetical protein
VAQLDFPDRKIRQLPAGRLAVLDAMLKSLDHRSLCHLFEDSYIYKYALRECPYRSSIYQKSKYY